MAVLTLIQREERLVEFLRAALPGHRVVASLQRRDEATRRGDVRLPEVRVVAATPGGNGVLRWHIQISNGETAGGDRRRVGPDGVLVAAQRLRDELARGTHPWRSIESAARDTDGVGELTEQLEEAWTPAGRVPQRLFVYAVAYGTVVSATIPAGTNEFSVVEDPPPTPPPGAEVFGLLDLSDAEYLGAISAVGPPLRTEFGTLTARSIGIGLYTTSGTVSAPEAGSEEESFNADDWRRLDVGIVGHRRQKLLGQPRSRLTLHFPLLPPKVTREWLDFLATHRDRTTFLLVRADRSLAEVSLLAAESAQRGDGQAGSLKLTFLAQPLRSLSAFEEVPS